MLQTEPEEKQNRTRTENKRENRGPLRGLSQPLKGRPSMIRPARC